MAKMSKDELKNKYSERITDNDDLLIELLEDIEDSFEEAGIDTSKIDDLQEKYDNLMTKYKDRFLSGGQKEETEEEETKDEEEKKVIDVKEI